MKTRTQQPAGAVQQDFPPRLEVMLLHAAKQPFTMDGWIFEPKLDGMRCIALIRDGGCRLYSRNWRNITEVFPGVAGALTGQGDFILDGELIACHDDGSPDFEALRGRWLLSKEKEIKIAEQDVPTAFFAFDILHDSGYDLTRCKLLDRKEVLYKRLQETDNTKPIAVFEDGLALWDVCRQKKLEGMVCKRKDSLYRPGQRSKDWLKVKFTELDTFVIVGYNRDEGFLVADEVSDEPVIVGSVEFGFSERNYNELLACLRPAEKHLGKRRRRETIWFQQEVWIKVEYMERTSNGLLRAPVFRGLSVRDD